MVTTKPSVYKVAVSVSLFSFSPLLIAADTQKQDQHIEEVLVTAQKRAQSIYDVPMSLSAMTEQQLAEKQIQQLPDLAFHVPNMQLSGAFGNAQPVYAIRGVTTADYNTNQSSSIGVYIDEAYYGAVFTHGAQLFDVERVEVLRGPQGTLYGKNTTGGSINIHSNSPEINTETLGNVALELGNYDYHRFDMAAQTSLIEDKAAARFAFYSLKHGGYVDNKIGDDMTAANNWGGRLSLLWRVNERVEAELKVSKIRMDGRATAPRTEGRIPTPSGQVDISGYQREELDFHESEIDFIGDTELAMEAAVLQVTMQASSFDVILVTAWNQAEYDNFLDVDGSPFIQDHNRVLAKSDSWSQDLRVQSSGNEQFSYIAGLYVSKEKLETSTSYQLYGSPNVLQLNPATQAFGDLLTQFGTLTALMDITRKSQALYGQTRWEFADRWGLDIGLRYTHDEDKLDYANVSRYRDGVGIGSWAPGNITEGGLNIDAPFIPPGVLGPADPGQYTNGPFTLRSIDTFSAKHDEWTGKLGIDYQWSDSTMVFASVSRGYRSGNFLGGAYYIDRGQDELYADPEFINVYEVGSKYISEDQRLRVSSALFYYDYSDMQFVNIVGGNARVGKCRRS